MANFTKWEDLHDYNRKLMEDDWNEGSHYVVKLKSKTEAGNEFTNTTKVGHAQPTDELHSLKNELKMKVREGK